jgi:DNA polymerase-3 subunit beta
LTGARSTYQLNGLSPDDYPPPPDLSEAGFIDLPSETLVDMIDKTISSVAVEETRYNLAGVYVEKGELDGKPVLRMVSTDGHRLSLMERGLDGLAGLKLDKGVIISKKAMNEIRKLSEEEGTLKLGFGGNSAMIKGERMYLVMRLLEGRFPDYNLVIPKNNDKVFQVGRKDFQDVLKRISIMSTDDFKGVKFSLSPKELTLSVVNPDLGRAEESLPVEYEGDEVEIGFNPRYFIESLASLKSDAISVALKDSGNPCLVTASEDVGFRGVIMPMKI